MARHQPLFSTRRPARSLVLASVLGLGILLGGCQEKILQHGNVPDEDQVVQMWDPLESTCRHASLSIL